MKNNLGKLLLLLLITQVTLFASTYTWTTQVDKKKAYTNEAIYIKYVCTFSDESELYVLEFDPTISNDKYAIELLSETERVINEKRINTYEFILYVKQAGHFELDLETNIKKTNKDSIENSVLGRDNANYEEFSSKLYKHKTISLDIEDTTTQLVGEFQLRVKKDVPEVKAFEPYHLEITIEGSGGLRDIKELDFRVKDTKVFSQKTMLDTKLQKDGYHGSWNQKFAFVSEQDFLIPSFKIEYFDLKSKTIKKLSFDEIKVKVEKAYEKKDLLDEEEQDFIFPIETVYYLLSFILGFIVAKIKIKPKKQVSSQEELFRKKVQNTKTMDEVLILLVLSNKSKYQELITKIEKQELKSLSKVKKLLLN